MGKLVEETPVPYLYSGPTCNLGRFGFVKSGTVIYLLQSEAAYVQDDDDFERITEEEAKKHTVKDAEIKASEPSDEEGEEDENEEEEQLTDNDIRDNLLKMYPNRKDLIDYAAENGIESVKVNDLKDVILDKIVAHLKA